MFSPLLRHVIFGYYYPNKYFCTFFYSNLKVIGIVYELFT